MGCTVIMTASCKGGVGKTTVTANLGMALALDGHRTLMLDCDFGMRCLDLVAGFADAAMFDVCDCILRDISPARAALRDERCDKLFFIAAPYRYEGGLDRDNFRFFLRRAAQELELEYIIIDTHGGEGAEFPLAAASADLALIVSTHSETSVRAAEETQNRLAACGVTRTRLIINMYDRRAAKRGELPGIIELIDRTRVQLIGVIPLEAGMQANQEAGRAAAGDPRSRAGLAFTNTARRIEGYSIPLSVR